MSEMNVRTRLLLTKFKDFLNILNINLIDEGYDPINYVKIHNSVK